MPCVLEKPQERDYQTRVIEKTLAFFEAGDNSVLIESPTGCHRAGQGILMFDGSVKPVEQVQVGDKLVGPDGRARTVLQLCRGRGNMAKITPVKGESWVVNEDHVLTLVRTNASRKYPRTRRDCLDGEMVDVSVSEWLEWSKARKHLYKLFRVGVDRFCAPRPNRKKLPISPYHLGLLLGDGSMKHTFVALTTSEPEIVKAAREIRQSFGLQLRTNPAGGQSINYIFTTGCKGTRNTLKETLTQLGLRWGANKGAGSADKFVPQQYKAASRSDRLAILAGLIDADGHLAGNCYDYVSKSLRLADDAAFLARSLGMAAYIKPCTKSSQRGTSGTYYRVLISGHVDCIPCRLPRKKARPRTQKKNPLRTGLSIRRLGVERYFGFTLTGDGRYLLDDFTVTHNSGKTIMALAVCKHLEEQHSLRTNWVAMRRNLLRQVIEANERFFGLERLTPVSMFEKNPPKADITVVDEAQHDATASASNIHEHSGSRFILGLSATPQRTDNLKLAFRRTVRDAGIHRLIRDGWLAPYDHWCIDKWDPASVAETYLREPDTWGRSAVFFHRIEQCAEFASILAGHGHHAEVITADTDREAQLDAFDDGEFDVVANVAILNEGFDCPGLRTVFVRDSARLPTVQMAGRGFRLSPETGKTHCNIVQSGNAHWQFTRTARARQTYARRGDRWLALGNSMVLDAIAQQTVHDIASVEIALPKYLSQASQKKRKSADRRQRQRNDRD